jgi:hypothetical protein
LHGEDLVVPLAISYSDNVQCNVKRNLDVDELKPISKHKPFLNNKIVDSFYVTFL